MSSTTVNRLLATGAILYGSVAVYGGIRNDVLNVSALFIMLIGFYIFGGTYDD